MRLALQARPGVHCETTTLGAMLRHAGADVSEPMLFGLGQGIDFQYWEPPAPGLTPMLTGRTGAGELARNACAALGVELRESQEADQAAAEQRAAELLRAGSVVGVTVDIYYLDYFTSKSHFAAHCIALYGLDDTTAYVVDTEQQGGARELSVESLRLARGSTEGFMPSPNRQLHLGPLPERLTADPEPLLLDRAWGAMRAAARTVLDDRGPRFGIAGLRRAAAEIPGWRDALASDVELVPATGRFWRYAGTGGTNFRGLYLDFLREVRSRSGEVRLDPVIGAFEQLRQDWDEVIELLLGYGDAGNGAVGGPEQRQQQLNTVGARLAAIADAEQAAFGRLLDVTTDIAG
ncbi:BtrH N-terminal domain-containing protein [Kitasatospora sp. NPDC059160]|uniref:BtrH N-terminal domain-containing protein n=1 Tax=Kitasatospora sp. NPDC059160 TaxID=3346748 RepID=UPI00369AF989